MMEMKAEEFAAWVGSTGQIKNMPGRCTPPAGEVEHGELDHTPEAVELWATKLAQRFNGRAIAVALEQARGSLIFMLTKYAHLVIFPGHGATLANYRKGFRPAAALMRPTRSQKAPSIK